MGAYLFWLMSNTSDSLFELKPAGPFAYARRRRTAKGNGRALVGRGRSESREGWRQTQAALPDFATISSATFFGTGS